MGIFLISVALIVTLLNLWPYAILFAMCTMLLFVVAAWATL
jgi:hypothetical protein